MRIQGVATTTAHSLPLLSVACLRIINAACQEADMEHEATDANDQNERIWTYVLVVLLVVAVLLIANLIGAINVIG